MVIRGLKAKVEKEEEYRGYLSHSQVGMMLRCAAQYEFRYMQHIKLAPPGFFIQGSAYHGGVEFGYSVKKEKQELPKIADIQDAADKTWNTRISQEDKIDWNGNPGSLKDEVMVLLEKYAEKIMPTISPVAIELREQIEVEGIPFVRVRDLVLEDGTTVDHKLIKSRLSANQRYSDLQSLAYTYPNGGKFQYHMALKQKVKAVEIFPLDRTKAEVEWYGSLVKKVNQQIKAGIFPPNPGGYYCHPDWCGYWKLCRGK